MTLEERLWRAHRKMTPGTLGGRSLVAQRQRLTPRRVEPQTAAGEWCGSPPGTQSPFGTGAVNMHDSFVDTAADVELSGLSTATATVLDLLATRSYSFALSVTFELVTAPTNPGEVAGVEASWGLFDDTFTPVDGGSADDVLSTVGQQATVTLSGSFAATAGWYFVPGIAGEGIGSTYVSRVVAGSLCVEEA